jgi:GNAT superfamily N-acetyltransferase
MSSLKVSKVSCTPTMLKHLEAMDRKCFPREETFPTKERAWWWLARWDDADAGFGGLLECDEGKSGFLCRAGVFSDYRGRGIQLRLIQERVRYSRSVGHTQVLTYTTHDNAPSNNNLIRAGFRQYLPVYPWEGSSFMYWYYAL